MDGAGRPARSLRSPRPQTDLKAAAIGAVMLLRERLGSARVSGKRSGRREQRDRLSDLLERYLPNRTGVIATVLLLLASGGFGIVRGGHLAQLTTAASDARNAIATSAGFSLNRGAIPGRQQITPDEGVAARGGECRPPLLFLR